MSNAVIAGLEHALKAGEIASDRLLVQFGGAYLYYCQPDPGTRFSNGNLVRIGLIFLVPSHQSLEQGIDVGWSGARLGSSDDGVVFTKLDRPVPWSGRGIMCLKEGVLTVEYWLSDGSGLKYAIEWVSPVGDDGDWEGRFVATDIDGREIRGDVHHVRLENAAKLEKEFAGIPMRFWSLLDVKTVGEWGRRVYNQLPEDKKGTAE